MDLITCLLALQLRLLFSNTFRHAGFAAVARKYVVKGDGGGGGATHGV